MRNWVLPEPLPRSPPNVLAPGSARLCDSEDLFSLPREFVSPVMDIFDALQRRQSRRCFNALTLQEISTLLWFSRRRVASVPHTTMGRYPTASAGGLGSVQMIVLQPGAATWGYEPQGHKGYFVYARPNSARRVRELSKAFFDTTDATLILFAANRDYIAHYYDAPESLVLRESGALCATMQLLAEPLGLAFCALGTTAGQWLDLLLQPGNRNLIPLGAAAVGRR